MSNTDFITTFEKLTINPLDYLDVQLNVAKETTNLIKQLYDTTKSVEKKSDRAGVDNTLPELIVEDFDEEQIWQELELQNSARFESLANTIRKFKKNDLILLDGFSELDKRNAQVKLDKSEVSDDLNNDDEDDINENGTTEEEDDIEDDDVSNFDESKTQNSQKIFKTVVDDEFFKLSEMINFLESEEKLEATKDKQKNEDFIDMFQDISFDKEDNFGPMYQEFFDNVEITKKKGKSKKNVRFELDEDNSENDNEKLNSDENDKEPLSSLEKRSKRINKRIAQLEEEAVSDNKPWVLKGEVKAKDRPQNSLLEEDVEFDVCTRPAPIITEETTVKLEDIILQRIKDKAWDDVERKIKLAKAPQEFKKQLVLNQEKSKESLSQIYEKEFIKQREAADPENKNRPEEEPQEHKEIDLMIKELFRKLDALTNYHYTPKQAIPELKIIHNLPAISMEEVAPIATTDATLLAPEEIQGKFKAPLLSKEERTKTDQKRERRKKKHLQHKKRIMKESNQKELEKRGIKPKQNKGSAIKELKQLTSSGHQIKELKSMDGKMMKTSTDFFSRLQDKVKNEIDGKRKTLKLSDKKNCKKFKSK